MLDLIIVLMIAVCAWIFGWSCAWIAGAFKIIKQGVPDHGN